MLVPNFIKLSAAVYELSCRQSYDDVENNTAVASAGSKNPTTLKTRRYTTLPRINVRSFVLACVLAKDGHRLTEHQMSCYDTIQSVISAAVTWTV